jgi:hypothetical protein
MTCHIKTDSHLRDSLGDGSQLHKEKMVKNIFYFQFTSPHQFIGVSSLESDLIPVGETSPCAELL